MNNAQTNQQTNYVLKLLDENYQAKNNFQYPQEVGATISCPDWEPTQNCGNGLHGFLNEEGDLSSTDYRAKAMILDVNDYIDLGGKIKFESATVVAFGEVFEITAKLRGLVGNDKVINLLNLSSTQTEFWIAGGESTLSAGNYSTLTAGDKSILIVRGDTCFIVKNGESCILNMFFDDECVTVKLDSKLKKFKIGDGVKIFEGKVVGKM